MKDKKYISRFIKHDESGEEIIIKGKGSDTFRKILESEWPFKKVEKNTD